MIQSTSIFSQSFTIEGIIVDNNKKNEVFVNISKHDSNTYIDAGTSITTKYKRCPLYSNLHTEYINVTKTIKTFNDWLSIKKLDLYENYPICQFNYKIYSLQEIKLPADIKGEILHYNLSSSKNFYPLGFPYSYYLLNLTLKKSFISNRLNMKLKVNYIIKK